MDENEMQFAEFVERAHKEVIEDPSPRMVAAADQLRQHAKELFVPAGDGMLRALMGVVNHDTRDMVAGQLMLAGYLRSLDREQLTVLLGFMMELTLCEVVARYPDEETLRKSIQDPNDGTFAYFQGGELMPDDLH